MEERKIGTYGHLFIFDDLDNCPTHVYVRIGRKFIFIVDTYLGPSYLQPVLDYVSEYGVEKETVIINTHYDWDHIWGNMSFPTAHIIAQERQILLLEQHFQLQLASNQQYVKDAIIRINPTITFGDKLEFPDENITIWHTPGHTSDSLSIYDSEDEVLLVGDNVEEPEPYENDVPRSEFVKTLHSYLDIPFRHLIAGHFYGTDTKMIQQNIDRLS